MTIIQDKKTGVYKGRVATSEGKTATVSTGTKNREAAVKLLKQSRLAEIEDAAKAGRLAQLGVNKILGKQKVTVADAVEQFGKWLEHNGRARIYVHHAAGILHTFLIQNKLENSLVADITEKQIYDFVNCHSKTSASWRRTKLSALRKFFELASARGWVLGNPAKAVNVRMDMLTHSQKEKRQRRPFTDKETDKLLAQVEVGSFWYSAIVIARHTGLRIGDIVQLEWDCLTKPGRIVVWSDKRDRRIELFLNKELSEAIGNIPPKSDQYLFPEERAMYLDENRRANLATYFRRICHKAGISNRSFHDLRSTYITACHNSGIPIEHIAKRVGHSSVETTYGYMGKRNGRNHD